MIEIRNVTADVDDGKRRQLNPVALNRIAVHRAGVDLVWDNLIGYDAISICDAFAGRDPKWADTVAKATGGNIPYSFMIGGNLGPDEFDGVVWQTLRVFEAGAHARRWSATAVGICVIADPRVRPCSDKQRGALIQLLGDLCPAFGIDPTSHDENGIPYLAGHDELPGGSKDPNKRCPGKHLPMSETRQSVATAVARTNRVEALNRLVTAGLST